MNIQITNDEYKELVSDQLKLETIANAFRSMDIYDFAKVVKAVLNTCSYEEIQENRRVMAQKMKEAGEE